MIYFRSIFCLNRYLRANLMFVLNRSYSCNAIFFRRYYKRFGIEFMKLNALRFNSVSSASSRSEIYKKPSEINRLDQPITSRNASVDRLSISEHIFYLRNYYATNYRVNTKELLTLIDRLEKYANDLQNGSIKNQVSCRSVHFRFLLHCCSTKSTPALRPEYLTQLAERIWAFVPIFGLKYDIGLFNGLIDVYYKNRCQRPTVRQLMTRVDTHLFFNDPGARERLIKLACRQGEMKLARSLFDSAKNVGNILSSRDYGRMLYGYLRIRDRKSYNHLVEEMKIDGIEWTPFTYTYVMKAYAEIKDVDEFFRVFEDADKKGILFDDKDLLDCVFVIALSFEMCEELIDKIFARLWQWEFGDFSRLIQRLISIDRSHAARHVFKLSPRHDGALDENDASLTDSGNFMIQQMFDIGSPIDAIFDMCEWLQKSGFNRRPYTMALHHAYSCGREDAAVECFSRLRLHDYEVRPQYVFPLLILRAKRGATIEELVDAMWLWFRSLRDKDKSDRLFDDGMFGLWYWPWTEHSRQIRAGLKQSTNYLSKSEELIEDLEKTMDGLVKGGYGVRANGGIQAVTSGNLLTGFVHHCLIKSQRDVIWQALTRYANVHICVYKLHVALARFYQRTGDANTVVRVLVAAGFDDGEPAGSVGFKAGNGELLKNLLDVVSLEYFLTLVEKMAAANLKIEAIPAEIILRRWSKSIKATNENDSTKTTELRNRLQDGINKLLKPRRRW